MEKENEERKYLEYALLSINKELNDAKKQIDELKKHKLTFDDGKRGEQFNKMALLNLYETKVKILQKMLSSPYFGRIDFESKEDNDLSKIYIGKNNVNSEGVNVVTDWRAPICSLYYDSELGKVSYHAPKGIIEGELKLKRQLIIENGELVDVLDTNLVTNDELLKPYLNINAENKMKTIIASIQKEQNSIIRKPIYKDIIVEGVAGSGKTSVALHRIAYLAYQLENNYISNQFLVIGPNKYFLDYVSQILPELDTEPVDQKTFIELVNEILNEKLTFQIENNSNIEERFLDKRIQRFKGSLEYKECIKNYLYDYINKDIVEDDFKIDDQVVFAKDYIKKILFSLGPYPDFKYLEFVLIKRFKDEMEIIFDELNKKYYDRYSKMSFDDPKREKYIKASIELKRTITKDGIKLLKKYVKSISLKPIDIYIKFLNNFEKYNTELCDLEIKKMVNDTVTQLKKKKVKNSDLAPLLYINYVLYGCNKNYKHIVIDEAQDYNIFQFSILKELFNESIFSIYGDLAQSINGFGTIKSFDEVNSLVFNNNVEMLKLNKSYRTTIEITENANRILRKLNYIPATPVIRHGSNVKYIDDNRIDTKLKIINNWLKQGYKTIAIICKTTKEAQNMYKELQLLNIPSNLISDNIEKYEGGIFVITSRQAKGLEFDCSIVSDVSSKVYDSNNYEDLHLLYVALTRALHEQVIIYKKDLTSVLKKDNQDVKRSNKVYSKRLVKNNKKQYEC